MQLIEHITTSFPPEPEEITAVEATLREPWLYNNLIDFKLVQHKSKLT